MTKKPALRENKKLRRQWLTWLRMARYGANNFTRNAWLTTAATAVMTVTLLIVFTTFVARSVLMSTVDDFRQKIDISVYLREDVSAKEVDVLKQKLYALDNVSRVRYIDTKEARENYIAKEKPTAEELKIISELPTTPFPPSLRVSVKDPNDLGSLEKLVREDEIFSRALNEDPRLAPSFAGKRREAIDNLGRWIATIEKVGLVASGTFIGISMLIIFNTIRMAIFNRRDEIEMMKLIGADRGFIRGPFVVEAVMYGFFAALVATAIGFAGFLTLVPRLQTYEIAVDETRNMLITFSPVVLLAIILVGALIGVISSRLAVRRYLKV